MFVPSTARHAREQLRRRRSDARRDAFVLQKSTFFSDVFVVHRRWRRGSELRSRLLVQRVCAEQQTRLSERRLKWQFPQRKKLHHSSGTFLFTADAT